MNVSYINFLSLGLCSLCITSALEPTALAQAPDTSSLVQQLRNKNPRPLSLPEAEPLTQIKEIKVSGSTVLTEKQVSKLVAPFIGKKVTFEELSAIRTTLTQFYISKGYVTSGVFLPPQNVSNGTIQFVAVEGTLEDIEIQCNRSNESLSTSAIAPDKVPSVSSAKCKKPALRRLQESYVTSRLKRGAGMPLNVFKLTEALQRLQQNPLFSRVKARLVAGSSPQKSLLLVELVQTPAISGTVVVDNKNSTAVGSTEITAALKDNSLLGLGDSLIVEGGFTGGKSTYNLSYILPVNTANGTIAINASRGRSRIIEQPFASLDINSQFTSYSLAFRQPLIESESTDFALGVVADIKRSQSYLFNNEPFSFNPGAENGKSNVTAIRFTQDWTRKNSTSVITLASRLNLGLGLFGATTNKMGTDGRFISWNGFAEWAQALDADKQAILVTRMTTQITTDSLLLGEQFAVGGVDSVRGYPYNYLVGDSGISGSIELQLPIVNDRNGIGSIQLVPFFDVGRVWNTSPSLRSNTLSSLGLGLRYQLKDYLYMNLDWGMPLLNTDSLPNNSLSFSIRLEPF